MYLVIFCYWVGPVSYLELFGVGPVEKTPCTITLDTEKQKIAVYHIRQFLTFDRSPNYDFSVCVLVSLVFNHVMTLQRAFVLS